MNNLKNIFGLHISRNVNSKSSQGIHQGENILKNKYLRSKSLKNVKSDPFLKSTKPNDDKFESNIVKVSNKTKTIYGGSRKSSKLERSNSLDSISVSHHQIVGFKNCIPNRVDSNEKQLQKSTKETKNSKQNLLNQEARSYAKLIANYSRAMETDTIYTRDFNQTYGRSSSSITDSPFNSLIPPFSKMKKKEIKSGTILNTRNSSSTSPKDHNRVLDIWNKSGNQNSFYSTDSDTYKEIVKTGDHMVTNPQNMSNTNQKQEFKLDVKDVLENVTARADWLDKVIKAHKELKTKNMIQNNYVTSESNLEKTFKKSNVNDSKPVPLLAVDAECPIESSFKPVIDSYASPTEITSNVDQEDRTEFKTSSKSEIINVESSKNYIEHSSKITGEKKSIFETENTNTKTKDYEKGKKDSKSVDEGLSTSSLNCINFQINGKPSSEYITENKSIKVVNSLEKIEIRIPISFLFSDKKKNDDDDDKIQKLKKSDSTLSLQISAKIETFEEQKVTKEVSLAQKGEKSSELKSNEKVPKEVPKVVSLAQKAEKSSELDLKSNEKAPKEVSVAEKSSELDLKSIEKKTVSKNLEVASQESKKSPIARKKKIDDTTTEDIIAKNPDNETIKKQKKTMNLPVENELQKQKEQKEEKITAPPVTIEKKNSSNIETMKPNQESRTIDKMTTTKTVIDQKVAKKLNDNVTPVVVGCKEISKKTLNPTGSLLKTKLKNPTEEVSSKKTIASSITEEKYSSATKESSEASKIYHTMDHGKQRTINIDSKDPLKLRIDNKNDFSTRKDMKIRRDNKKDIPLELKPMEKKKDGTLIDYGLKVATRKSKEQPIKATIKEVFTPKEKKFGNLQNDPVKANQVQTKKEINQVIGDPKLKKISKTILSIATTDVTSSIEESSEKAKFVEYKMVLKLHDFEENHIFSGTKSSRGNDSKKAGVLKSSMSARSERKNTTVKPDNKGSHAKTQNSSMIIDRGMVAVQIDDYSRNHQSTGKINSMRKNSMKLFSKTSQCNNGGAARSADYIERLAKTSLKKTFSEKSMTISSASLLKDKFKSSDKEILYSSWLQNYGSNVKVSELNR